MDGEQQMISRLLQEALERGKNASGEAAAFNILSILQIERQEREHSKIIFWLLNNGYIQDGRNVFLRFFLEALKIPRGFLDETWNVYREKAFDGGSGRIDFVLESKSFCAIIEMKIEAGDGDSQLARYASFGRKKQKEYTVYYLTLDGHEPTEQSSSGIEENRLRCISFKKEIIVWLQRCISKVEKEGYRYAFLKQYLGAVKDITGVNDGMVSVKDLLDSSDMAKAAQTVVNSFYEKMDDVQTEFFRKLGVIIKRRTKLEVHPYPYGLYIFLSEFTYRKHTYHVTLGFEVDSQLVILIGFTQKIEEDFYFLELNEAESTFPVLYRKWMNKIEALDCPQKFRSYKKSKWIYAENSRGGRFNFKDYSAQIQLIDEMDLQCKYIADDVIKLIIKPLLEP